MISNTDFEKLWFLYQTDGAPKGVSITSFCKHQGVPYNEFEKWYKKTHRTVARVEVTGAPQSDDETGRCKKPAASADKGGIHVTIKTRDGLFVQKGGLDYQGLRLLVERLEVLC